MTRTGPSFPRAPLLGAAALVALTLVAAAAGRLGGLGAVTQPDAAVVESRDLRFEDQTEGGVAIYDAANGRLVDIAPPGTNGFLRATMRGLARERRREGVGAEPPFRLTRWDDGRVSLDDPSTGRHVELVAFGPTNVQAFARLLTTGENAR